MIASIVMELAGQVDFLVVGAGVAGLRAAVELARHGDVLVVTKEAVAESNTHYAQGGIAVAMEGPEDVALHLGTRSQPGMDSCPCPPPGCWSPKVRCASRNSSRGARGSIATATT